MRRIFLDRFWNEFAGDPSKIDEATREHYAALYAQPGAMRASFAQFRAVWQDAEDNKLSMADKLTMPVLAIGGEKSFGATMATVKRNAAITNVTEAVVSGSGHWLMEESPTATIKLITDFLIGAGRSLCRPLFVPRLGRTDQQLFLDLGGVAAYLGLDLIGDVGVGLEEFPGVVPALADAGALFQEYQAPDLSIT